jgi:hypothetical protein
MPLATTVGLLMLMPVVETPIEHAVWAGEKISNGFATTKTAMMSGWNQIHAKTTYVLPGDDVPAIPAQTNSSVIP